MVLEQVFVCVEERARKSERERERETVNISCVSVYLSCVCVHMVRRYHQTARVPLVLMDVACFAHVF